MSSLPSFLLHGVQYEVPRVFQKGSAGKNPIELPVDFDIKDPEVLLEECSYDFAVEKNFLSTIPNYECKTKKEVSKNVDSSQKARQRHLKNPTDISKKSTVLPDTPDMARKQIKVAKSQTKENDDYQDLKDALAYAAEERQPKRSGKKSKSHSSSSSKSHKRQEGVEKYDRHDKDVGIPEDKANLLDTFADLLTDDVKLTEEA